MKIYLLREASTVKSRISVTIYTYNVAASQKALVNKRPVYRAMDHAPDGIKISRGKPLVTVTGHGIDVISPDGESFVRLQTNSTVINLAWTGKHSNELWAAVKGGITRIRWAFRSSLPI